MSKSTSAPHEDLLTDNKVTVTDLPQKTQTLLEKYKAETDEDKKETMDESLYGQIEDYLEDKATKEKAAKNKEKVAEHKKKKLDVSQAATATGKDGKNGSKDGEEKPKQRSVLNTIFGR